MMIRNLFNLLAFAVAPVFYKLLFLSLSAVLIGGMILLIRHFFDKKISPVWKYLMWALVLIALVVPYRPHSSLSLMTSYEPIEDISFREDYDNANYTYKLELQDEYTSSSSVEPLKQEQGTLFIKSLVFDVAIPLIWFFGMIFWFVFFAAGRFSLHRKIKAHSLPSAQYDDLLQRCRQQIHLRRPVKITVQDYLSSPAVIGVFRPQILLPNFEEGSISEESLYYIILHELSHLKRHDLLLNALLLCLQSVYWFNPFVWLLFRYMREDMELSNDSFVLKHIQPEQDKAYARSLVEVLGCSHHIAMMPKLLCMTDGAKNVKRRISMIKQKGAFQKHRVLISAVSLALIALLAALFLTRGKSSDEKAAEKLMESITCENGVISFHIPDKYPAENWNLHIAGRSENGGGMSVHLFEEENEAKKWLPNHIYQIDTNGMNYSELYLNIFLPNQVEREVDLLEEVKKEQDGQIKALYEARTPYIGKATAVSQVCSNVMPANLSYGIELVTSERPYILKILLQDPQNIDKEALQKSALKMFACIQNADAVSFLNGEEELLQVTSQQAETLLGSDYRQKAETFEEFAALMTKIDSLSFSEEATASISFPDLGDAPNFVLQGNFPQNWTLFAKEPDPSAKLYLPGDFQSPIYLYDVETPIAALGFSTFTPYEDEIEPENYYKTVYPDLRLSSFFQWDPYTAVSRSEDTETGVADIWQLDPSEIENYEGRLPDCPAIENKGILTYHKGIGVYVGISFAPDVISEEEITELAKSIVIVPSTQIQ